MGSFSDAVAGTGAVLKSVSGLIVFGFLIYSMYFTGHYELTFLKGILAFIVLGIFVSFTSMIPFGTTFAPILFEWWWHNIPFWDFTTSAWVITGISMVANVLLVVGIGLSQTKE
ncbi:MAG: hypothetical protein LKG23_11675 [Nitrospira sp.]|jgi:hypothetical protein|nr:hypothetical protein [Nitrospira sp.]